MQSLTALRGSLAFAVIASTLAAAAIACSGGGDDALPASGSDEAGLLDRATQPPREGGGGPDADAGYPTPQQACEAYVNAACARSTECGLSFNCERLLALCPDYLFAPGSSRGVSDVLACAALRRTQSCAELSAGIELPCATPGTRKKGEPCDFNVQCESDSCTGAGTCGTCQGLTPPDSGCPTAGNSCGMNMYCPAPGDGCVPKVAAPHLAPGDVCPRPDGGLLSCPADAPCSAPGPLADSGTCSTPPSSGACRFAVKQPLSTICAGGTACTFTDAAAPDGICVTGAPAGYFCGSIYGVTCAPGLYCPDSTFGAPCVATEKLNGACTAQAQCDPTAYCLFTAPGSGTCQPGAALGAPCGPVSNGGVSSTVTCVTGECKAVTLDAGSKPICVNKGASELQPCSLPLSPCYQGLECGSDQLCHLPSCPADAGKD